MKSVNQFFCALHVFLYRLTQGKIGGQMEGRNMLLLTTIGRKSGKTRVAPLGYVADGDGYLVLASVAGAPKNPGWYWNALEQSAPVEIQINDAKMTVHVAEIQGEERELAYAKYKQIMGVELIDGYEKKANRVFPLLRLTPQHVSTDAATR